MKSTKQTAPQTRRMRWAVAHKGLIYDVLDPELRSQTYNFRNKPMVKA